MCFFYSFQKSRIENYFTETYSLSQRVVAYSTKKGGAAQSATQRGGLKKRVDAPALPMAYTSLLL
jgi:hypothetical protein